MVIWYLENILRGDGYRLEGLTVVEGTVRYRNQGGGQDHTSQLRVPYRKKGKINNKAP